MAATILNSIAQEKGNVILQVSASDLRQIISEMYHSERKHTQKAIEGHRERPTLSRKEAAEALGISLATLWHWAKDGYLVPVKIGNKVMYRPSDIEKILQKA